jgi:hypothetical protein
MQTNDKRARRPHVFRDPGRWNGKAVCCKIVRLLLMHIVSSSHRALTDANLMGAGFLKLIAKWRNSKY